MEFRIAFGKYRQDIICRFDSYDTYSRAVLLGVGCENRFVIRVHIIELIKYPIIKTTARAALKFNKIQGLL